MLGGLDVAASEIVPFYALELRFVLISSSEGSSPQDRSPKALPKQVGHLDEEGAPVAAEAGFKLAAERTEAIASQVVVIADIERRAGIRRPAKKELSFVIRGQRI